LGCSSASLSGCCGTGGIGAAGDRAGFIMRLSFTGTKFVISDQFL
jgi:hypothetical protein